MAHRDLITFPAGKVTGTAMWAAAKLRVLQWNALAGNRAKLREVQEETLLEHCRVSANTEFGRVHGLSQIRSFEDFKRQVPLRTYADFEPYLERMRKGETDVLYPGLIPYYGQSSGSSNTNAQHKYLPISPAQIKWQQKSGFDVVARYLDLTGDRELSGGYFLALFPPSTIKQMGPVGVASNPGIMQLNVPYPAKLLQLPKPPIRDIPDYDQKLKAMAEAYLDYDVRSLSGTTCWFSIFFDQLLAAANRRGMNVTSVKQIWPNLRVLFGGGVYAEPYRQIIEERMGRSITLMDNYNATEGGVFACTDSRVDTSMLMLADRGVFFEFVARAEHGKPDAKRVPLWDVEPGVDYSIAVTTQSGLFAYYMGDVVRFDSIFPHRLQFSWRTGGVLSVTQELTSSLEIERAVGEATRKQNTTVIDFAASSEVGINGTAKGRYLLFVEFEKAPKDLQAFSEAFDQELCAQNRVYREHRARDVAILAPVVLPLPTGSTKKFMEQLGLNNFQNKFPRIIGDDRRELLRKYVQPT
ncbi:MAG: GH3 auxin-responsive promoter family protein [Archangiaceae bacterium]|nr:GH3 auxin-responsive promoter family protein [Archangiaceae bacterium]